MDLYIYYDNEGEVLTIKPDNIEYQIYGVLDIDYYITTMEFTGKYPSKVVKLDDKIEFIFE